MGKQIHHSGSAVPSVQPVFDTNKVVLDGAQKLLQEGKIHVLKHVEHECCLFMCIFEVRCFGSGGAFRDDKRCSGIGRGHDQFCQEGRVDRGR